MHRIAFVINQIKGNINNICGNIISILFRYHASYILITFNIYLICHSQSSLLSINFLENILLKCFHQYLQLLLQICLYFIKEVVVLSQIFAPRQETENPGLEVFFNIQFNCTGNPNAKIENVSRFGCSYTLDLTAHTCNEKNIDHYLLII